MVPITATTLANVGTAANPPAGKAATTGGASFEDTRNRLQAEQSQTVAQVTQHQFQITPAASSPRPAALDSPVAVLNAKATDTGASLKLLHQKVAALPQTGSTAPLRTRLESLENQFSNTGSAVEQANANTNPMALLKLQHELYQVDEQLELLSKVVEQATGGVRSVLQTQI